MCYCIHFLLIGNKVIYKQSFKNDKKCRVVNQSNVLWTCHKACKIEFGDCCYCICSVCYGKQTNQMVHDDPIARKPSRKRRRTNKNVDDNLNLCNHNLDALWYRLWIRHFL